MNEDRHDLNPFYPFHPAQRKEGSTMEYGSYFLMRRKPPFAYGARSIRVWLPPEYETCPDARFPVLYMSDGQNLVDRALSAYGDWHLDRVVHRLPEEGYTPPILVGIDCPKQPNLRVEELCPPYEVRPSVLPRKGELHPRANTYVDYIVNELKPLIDATFRTNPSKEATAIGGSSMGGIMAFYAYFYAKRTFGFSLSFSIPFFFFTTERWNAILDDLDYLSPETGKLAMYVGGDGYEKSFVGGNFRMLRYLREKGFGKDKLLFLQDPTRPHHEEAWADYSYPCLKFWLGDIS